MKAQDKDARMRIFIMESLVARSGKLLSPDLISEISTEILERMIEINEVPLYQPVEEQS